MGWIHHSSGEPNENVSPEFRATGRDVNGGYAEFMLAVEDYAFPIPAEFDDAEATPLLCAGAVGYRVLKLTGLKDGERLGLTGVRRFRSSRAADSQIPLSELKHLCLRTRPGISWLCETNRRCLVREHR